MRSSLTDCFPLPPSIVALLLAGSILEHLCALTPLKWPVEPGLAVLLALGPGDFLGQFEVVEALHILGQSVVRNGEAGEGLLHLGSVGSVAADAVPGVVRDLESLPGTWAWQPQSAQHISPLS